MEERIFDTFFREKPAMMLVNLKNGKERSKVSIGEIQKQLLPRSKKSLVKKNNGNHCQEKIISSYQKWLRKRQSSTTKLGQRDLLPRRVEKSSLYENRSCAVCQSVMTVTISSSNRYQSTIRVPGIHVSQISFCSIRCPIAGNRHSA